MCFGTGGYEERSFDIIDEDAVEYDFPRLGSEFYIRFPVDIDEGVPTRMKVIATINYMKPYTGKVHQYKSKTVTYKMMDDNAQYFRNAFSDDDRLAAYRIVKNHATNPSLDHWTVTDDDFKLELATTLNAYSEPLTDQFNDMVENLKAALEKTRKANWTNVTVDKVTLDTFKLSDSGTSRSLQRTELDFGTTKKIHSSHYQNFQHIVIQRRLLKLELLPKL